MPLLAPPPPSLPYVPLGSFLELALTRSNGVKSMLLLLFPDILYILPAIALSLLFFSSTPFTESISKSKYPTAYAAYQKRVGMFGPTITLGKSIIHVFLRDKAEREKIDALVWGELEDTKKSQ
jgi:hypothetical protein